MTRLPASPANCLVLCVTWIGSVVAAAAEPAEKTGDVTQKAHLLLRARCLPCHGADAKDLKGEFDLRSRAAALRGGESGTAAIVPGQSKDSPLMSAIRRENPNTAMPPKENDRLSPQEIQLVQQWIDLGAPWPTADAPGNSNRPAKDSSSGGIVVRTSAGRSPDWNEREYTREEVWAFLPPRDIPIPSNSKATTAAPAQHPIDAFLLERLHEKGFMEFAPRANPQHLVRRAYLDLTGLPPTAEEVDEFVRQSAAGFETTYLTLIERLLTSSHYGEQMARHWLDVTRYADSSGFSNDFERPSAWRYRDYVVRSFNADKPFDQFVVQQIAGDELSPANPEMQIATGFLRMGPWEHTGMTVAAITRQQFLDDVVNHVGVVFLGQPLRCAACHDHKFDPIPTTDYYRLQAVFANTHFADRALPYLEVENTSSCETSRQRTLQRIAEADEARAKLKKRSEDAVAAYLKEKNVTRVEDLPVEERPKKDYLGYKIGLSDQDLTLRKVYQKRIDYLNRELRRYEPYVFSVYTGAANTYLSNNLNNQVPVKKNYEVPATNVLIGGSLETPAELVTPGVLSAVAGSNDRLSADAWNSIPSEAEGRRLAFAKWIASPRNTLTARVFVNRVWQWHFGRGLVETTNNFGKMGARPSHPELLDWLSVWFVKSGWSVKKLHQLIMTSAAYQQGTVSPAAKELETIDPKNLLLGRFSPRRLSAEELRDSLLVATGELNRETGGPPIFPEIAWEDALQPRHIMGSVAPAYQPSRTANERNRRTLYAFKFRTLPDPLLATFNKPPSELSCDRRDETTVAPQALALFNGEFAHDRSITLAARLAKEQPTIDSQITAAFRQIYLRRPTNIELSWCRDHVSQRIADHRRRKPTATAPPRRVKRTMVEELTGEEIQWDEELDLMRDYQSDLKPWDVSAEVRALADLCLVLMNSNEFVYVR